MPKSLPYGLRKFADYAKRLERDPKYPALGPQLLARRLCLSAAPLPLVKRFAKIYGKRYNARVAAQFVEDAYHLCDPYGF